MSSIKLSVFIIALASTNITAFVACGGDDDSAPKIVAADAGTSTSSDAKASSDSTAAADSK